MLLLPSHFHPFPSRLLFTEILPLDTIRELHSSPSVCPLSYEPLHFTYSLLVLTFVLTMCH
jgi:hypothetical protein